MTTVVVVDGAEAQLVESDSWWVAHRSSSPTLGIDEFERCVSLLEFSPDIGTRSHSATVPGVRRIVMTKTRHDVYYVHDETNEIVTRHWVPPKYSVPARASGAPGNTPPETTAA